MKKILAAVLSIAAALSLAACSEKKDIYPEKTSQPAASKPGNSSSSTDSGDVYAVTDKKFSPISVTNNNLTNSLRLFDEMYDTNEKAMFSPLSLNMCLGMLQAGADGVSKEALSKYLCTDDYAAFAGEYIKHAADFSFQSPEGSYTKYKNVFELANSVWTGSIYPINDAYFTKVKSSFGAELDTVDFMDAAGASETINAWVNEKTHEMIPRIITPEMLSADTAAVLVNTVYFESAWDNEWWLCGEKEDFKNADGSTAQLELMRNSGGAYYENDKAEAFSCGYMNGMKFIGILPKAEGDFTLEGLDLESLLASKTYDYDVFARMPKLTFDSSFPLNDVLKAAGMENIFDPDNANFSSMTANDDEQFFVSSILQKTSLELDEQGTRAAAVTAAIMDVENAAAPEEREKKEVFLNRPFAFLIYDEEAGEIVFVGKVTKLDE